MQGNGFGGGFFENLFGDLGFEIFGTARTAGRSGGSPGARNRGAADLDREAPLAVTLEEAYRGVEKTVTIPRDDESRTLSVTVPPGVKTGSRLRMKGEGEAGGNGRGDLYLVVEVLPHRHSSARAATS